MFGMTTNKYQSNVIASLPSAAVAVARTVIANVVATVSVATAMTGMNAPSATATKVANQMITAVAEEASKARAKGKAGNLCRRALPSAIIMKLRHLAEVTEIRITPKGLDNFRMGQRPIYARGTFLSQSRVTTN